VASQPPGVYGCGVALIGVLLFGILNGVVIAAVVSILLLLHHAARPHVAFLGRIPDTLRFTDLARHQDNEQIPGVLAFRVESPILYSTSTTFSESCSIVSKPRANRCSGRLRSFNLADGGSRWRENVP
jgi:SulP family sulfate permease